MVGQVHLLDSVKHYSLPLFSQFTVSKFFLVLVFYYNLSPIPIFYSDVLALPIFKQEESNLPPDNENKILPFQYVLCAATSPAVKLHDETLTYLNQGLFLLNYCIQGVYNYCIQNIYIYFLQHYDMARYGAAMLA